MENFFGGLAFGLLMLANMIGLCGLFACYVVMPLHTLWLIFRKFVPSKNFIENQKNFRTSIYYLMAAYASMGGYHLFVLNIKYPDSFLATVFHIIPFGFFLLFEIHQQKAYLKKS
jgi:hypothetical protein